ncbi:hypothetical protein Pla163_33590 [Planctomycetes bacterium Pla163]|uniref:Plasmid stabilization system protein n=1 Tax=Rohdeia mirabilis TaxID=2528008 RepID=A0A518D430_9BACT|nr:hypothetical protein Pla163_33590 [Planctomycetes bacterium Pla163]
MRSVEFSPDVVVDRGNITSTWTDAAATRRRCDLFRRTFQVLAREPDLGRRCTLVDDDGRDLREVVMGLYLIVYEVTERTIRVRHISPEARVLEHRELLRPRR